MNAESTSKHDGACAMAADEGVRVPDKLVRAGNVPLLEPLLVPAWQAAAMCSRSLRTWRSLDSAGKIPRAVMIGKSKFWRVDELRAWVAAGCPCRKEWEART